MKHVLPMESVPPRAMSWSVVAIVRFELVDVRAQVAA